MNSETKSNILKAGKIASEVREYAKSFIKPNIPLLDIAEKIEAKIVELGAKPAFPTNLSINEIAAHYTPSYNDETKAEGLLKIDFGAHVDGSIADTAFTLDLEDSEENKQLITASGAALISATQIAKQEETPGQLGKTIQTTIESQGFIPIVNLSGHSMEEYELHAGITIPNIENNNLEKLKTGLYAIEPFATLNTGSGKVKDGKPSGIYLLADTKTPRSPLARKILEYIADEYQAMPFCSRWIVKKFSPNAIFALNQLEQMGNLHHFPQLVESSNTKVSQAEHTILIEKDKTIITTE